MFMLLFELLPGTQQCTVFSWAIRVHEVGVNGLCSSLLKCMGPSGTLCLLLLEPLKILLKSITRFKAKLSLGHETTRRNVVTQCPAVHSW